MLDLEHKFRVRPGDARPASPKTSALWSNPAFARVCGLLLLTAVTAACAFSRLWKDIEEIKHSAMITGRVRSGSPQAGAVYVVHFKDAGGRIRRSAVERLPPEVTEYGFFVDPSDRHFVVAFQDVNGDQAWQSGEPVGTLPGADFVEVSPRQHLSLAEIALSSDGRSLPQFDLDLRSETFQAGLPFARGELTRLDNPAFAPERADEGMWTPLTAAKNTGFGIYFLQEYDPGKTPVLFVHGIRGSPRNFGALIAALDTTRYQAWVAYYPSGIRLRIVAHILHDMLIALRDRLHVARLVLTAHSMGGLVSRAALLELARDGHEGFIRPFVTIATPYEGHDAAASGVKYAPAVVPSWVDMAPGSEFLESLRAPLPRSVPFYMFFCVSERSMMVGGNNDGVVTLNSQLADYAQDDAIRIYGRATGHEGVLSDPGLLLRYRELLASHE